MRQPISWLKFSRLSRPNNGLSRANAGIQNTGKTARSRNNRLTQSPLTLFKNCLVEEKSPHEKHQAIELFQPGKTPRLNTAREGFGMYLLEMLYS